MKQTLIAPSILSADFSNLGGAVLNIANCGADMVHCDVMDGVFVNNITFGIKMVSDIKNVTDLPLDCHLMIVNPEKYVERFAKAGASLISVHYETLKENLIPTLKLIKSFGVKAGIAINPDTPTDKILDAIPFSDFVLCMTVFPGFSGQSFIPSVLPKIKAINDFIQKNNLSVDIEVDGGINLLNVSSVKSSGANLIVAGNTVFKSLDMKQTIFDLKNL